MGKFIPKISVVVPIYNVEKFLEDCLDSLVHQTYKDFEVLMINDGSTDSSPLIAQKYADKYGNFILINRENGGLSAARNTGIDNASGDYIYFLDSDDYIECYTLEKLYNTIITNDCDVVWANLYFEDWKTKKKNLLEMSLKNDIGKILSGHDVLEHYYLYGSMDVTVACNKLYKLNLFNDKDKLRFSLGRYHEDRYIMYKIYYKANKITVINIPTYHYVQHDNSIMHNVGVKNINDYNDLILEYAKWSKDKEHKIKLIMQIAIFKAYLAMFNMCLTYSGAYKCLNSVIEKKDLVLGYIEDFENNEYITPQMLIDYNLVMKGKYVSKFKQKQLWAKIIGSLKWRLKKILFINDK